MIPNQSDVLREGLKPDSGVARVEQRAVAQRAVARVLEAHHALAEAQRRVVGALEEC